MSTTPMTSGAGYGRPSAPSRRAERSDPLAMGLATFAIVVVLGCLVLWVVGSLLGLLAARNGDSGMWWTLQWIRSGLELVAFVLALVALARTKGRGALQGVGTGFAGAVALDAVLVNAGLLVERMLP